MKQNSANQNERSSPLEAGISVLICCYNSAARLPETLKHLALQTVPANIPWEVIVVDNASTDDTFDVANQLGCEFGFTSENFKVLKERTAGKNYAFKKGLFEAKFEFLLTCDDDNRLADNYLIEAFKIMNSDSNIGVLGGCGILDPEEPRWAEIEKYKSIYVTGPQTAAETDHWVYGAGSICRKGVLVDLYHRGWQQVTSGRKKAKLICGEDVEICFMYFLCGYKIKSSNQLLFKHFVPLVRQNEAYVVKMAFWLAYTNVLLTNYFKIIHQEKVSVKPAVNVRTGINRWYVNSFKTLIKHGILLSLKAKTITNLQITDRIAINSSLGTFISLQQNRKKVINHHDHILKLISAPNNAD